MNSRTLVALIPIILLGFALRLHKLEAVPLRGDEAFSVLYWADAPLSVSLTQIAQGEPHTPLVYAVGRFWGRFIGGIDSVFALRFLSVLGNLVGIAGLYALGWRLTRSRTVALLAALMWALHPFEIWHGGEFRNYGYWAGASVMGLWLGLRLIDGQRRRIDWLLYALVAGFATLTIYTEAFFLLALSAFALLERARERGFLARLYALQGIPLALLLAGFWLIQARSGFAAEYPGLAGVFALGDYLTRFLPTLIVGATLPIDGALMGLALTPVVGLAAILIYRESPRQFRFIALAGVLPLLLLGLASARWNLFHPRYVLAAVPAFILLLSLGAWRLAGGLRRRIPASQSAFACALLLPWLALSLVGLNGHYNDPAFRRAPAWDALAAFINPRVGPEDLVIQLSVDPAFGYYYRGVADETALPIHPSQPVAEIEARLAELSGNYQSVYVVSREQAGWPNAGAVVGWMRENMQETLLTDTAGLPVRQFMPWSAPKTFDDPLAVFGETVALVGHEFDPNPLPTGELPLWLYWKPLALRDSSLKSFAHVYRADGSLATQADQEPQQGRLDSRSWRLGVVFRDVYYLPARELAAGDYALRVGWYEPESGARLTLEAGGDALLLERFAFPGRGRHD